MPMYLPPMTGDTEVTDEMRAQAMKTIENELAQIKGMVVRLDLPATAVPNVIEFYSQALTNVVYQHEAKRMKERRKKFRDKMRAEGTDQQHPGFGHPIRRMGGHVMPAPPMFPDWMIDDEDD